LEYAEEIHGAEDIIGYAHWKMRPFSLSLESLCRNSHPLYSRIHLNLALININQLVTVSAEGKRVKVGADMNKLGVVENGAVLVENGTIKWVGRMEELSIGSLKDAEILDCLDKVVMPGFVDPHTHLVFAGGREEEFAMRNAGATYGQIAANGGGILSTMRDVRSASKKELKKIARRHLNGMLRQGTLTVEIKSGYGLDVEAEMKMLEAIAELSEEEVIDIVGTFLGAHTIPPEFRERKKEYVHQITERMIPYVGTKKLAEYCDVFCDDGFFDLEDAREILLQGQRFGMASKIHAEELSANGGAELAADIGAVSADHLEHISDAGIRALAKSGVVATVLPGVSFILQHGYAPARKLIDAGVPLAISTDCNPGSCLSYSMPLMMTIACTQMHLTCEEAITAATLNAAAAIRRSQEIGSIEQGKKADMILLEIPNYKYLPYHFGENHVVKVVKNGVVLEL